MKGSKIKKKELFALVFLKNCAWHGHRYSWMSMEKARKFAKKWFGVKIEERSASRYMHDLREEGVFERQRRGFKRGSGRTVQQSSLTYLKEGAFRILGWYQKIGRIYPLLGDAPRKAYNPSNKGEVYHPSVEKKGLDTQSSLKGARSAVFRTA